MLLGNIGKRRYFRSLSLPCSCVGADKQDVVSGKLKYAFPRGAWERVSSPGSCNPGFFCSFVGDSPQNYKTLEFFKEPVFG
jgi:hypothetical protein